MLRRWPVKEKDKRGDGNVPTFSEYWIFAIILCLHLPWKDFSGLGGFGVILKGCSSG